MTEEKASYDAGEQDVLAQVFSDMLRATTKDGGEKRARGEKPPWWRDGQHEAAIFSHINKWKHSEVQDADSGVHPLVHLAWRALAIAYQETYGRRDPVDFWFRSTAQPTAYEIGAREAAAWLDRDVEIYT